MKTFGFSLRKKLFATMLPKIAQNPFLGILHGNSVEIAILLKDGPQDGARHPILDLHIVTDYGKRHYNSTLFSMFDIARTTHRIVIGFSSKYLLEVI